MIGDDEPHGLVATAATEVARIRLRDHPAWQGTACALESAFGEERLRERLEEIEELEPWIKRSVCAPTLALRGDLAGRAVLVIGDLHGDLAAMARLVALWRNPRVLVEQGLLASSERRPAVALLGDFIDRGTESASCAALALQLRLAVPERSILLAGNHESAVFENDRDGSFRSEVEPAEFVEWVHASPVAGGASARSRNRLARCIACLGQRGPRAAFVGAEWLLTHGGVPHEDLCGRTDTLEHLQRCPAVREDFSWIRLHPAAPSKIPNRARRGCEIGVRQFESGVEHLRRLVDPHAMLDDPWIAVRGHDHPAQGIRVQHGPRSGRAILTLHSMRTDDDIAHAVLLRPEGAPVALRCEG